jgi:hypothetical protein
MAAHLQAAGVPHDRVYITQYFDPTRDSTGQPCSFPHFLGYMGTADAKSAHSGVVAPLNRQVANAAAAHRWKLISGVEQAFSTHGYCAGGRSWIVPLGQSLYDQGDRSGTMHPNIAGHQQIATLVLRRLQPDLLPHGNPRPLG